MQQGSAVADIGPLLEKADLEEGGARSLHRTLDALLELAREFPVALARAEILPVLAKVNTQLEDALVELRAEVASLDAQLSHCQTRRAKQLLEAKVRDKRWSCHDIVEGSGGASCDGSMLMLPLQILQLIGADAEALAELKATPDLIRFLCEVLSRRGTDAKPRRSAALQFLLSSATAAELMGAGLCDPAVECLRRDLELEKVEDMGRERKLSLQLLLRLTDVGERATTEFSALGVRELAGRAMRGGLRADNGLRADCGVCVQPALALVQQLSPCLPRPPAPAELAINTEWRDWSVH